MPGVDTTMNRAIVTLATGAHQRLQAIAWPSFDAFAKRHGWDLFRANGCANARPHAWYKLLAIKQLLENYDEVLSLDADVLIVDGAEDLTAPPEYWQAMVKHQTGDGEVPNTGVWLCCKEMIPILDKAWDKTEWLMHGWWDQAAILDLMGYHVLQPTHLEQPTELYEHTYFLDSGWNVHKWDRNNGNHARIRHATMYENREAIMLDWAKEAQRWING
jgi:hypothetical protein